jgi:UDP-2,3-diacylglucosamine pyrophosphatase LpxH
MENIFLKDRSLIVATDHHFPDNWSAIQPFCDLLESLDAKKFYLVFIGDLFYIWFGIQKTLSYEQKKFFQVLEVFREKGGKIVFLIGNTDILFTEKNRFLPFDYCSFEKIIFLNSRGSKMLFTHGDTINKQDKNYLQWRKFVHSFAMKYFINALPTSYSRKLARFITRKMKNINREKKENFYKGEWLNFLAENKDYDFCVVGHYHPQQMIIEQTAKNKGIILEAWKEKPAYLIIDENFKITHKLWKN